jgi:hypothetical protein
MSARLEAARRAIEARCLSVAAVEACVAGEAVASRMVEGEGDDIVFT